MDLSLNKKDFCEYTCNQLNNFFPDGNHVRSSEIATAFDSSIDRLQYCFDKVSFSRYNDGGNTSLNHLYSD